MGEVLLYLLSFVLGIAVPATIVRRDLARLAGDELARAWPDAGLWSAVVVFGPIAILVHFLRTRRSWLGVALALGWFLVGLFLIAAPVELLAHIFELSE